jgi:ABC-type glycerol-3-phosphate transport system substrate-binding protein
LLPAESLSAHYPIHLSGGRMKKLRITAALLAALAAAACSGSPTAPTLQAADTAVQFEGTGFMGSGTRQP